MHHILVERPRLSPGRSKRGRQANLELDILPRHQGMRRPHARRKTFTDLLGPLRRWLRSRFGRPWNVVYSEACAVIRPNSVVRGHLKQHLLEMVERHTFLHEGRVCFLRPWGGDGITPLDPATYPIRCFYVHPATGRLHEHRPLSRRRRGLRG
ncbi:MAG TPA: hypothetical protein DCM86_02755 [Verrucomicrobiales bacterium]|nr:hypothetical protein [Verrucomicrobiales bacterium]